jgi:GNAT superfamily N-acetyltransferase
MTKATILRNLGDGLILRRATAADAEPLAAFNAQIHRNPDMEGPDEPVAFWTRDLFRGDHPTFALEDFTIVEDTRTGAIVSSLNLIPQTWAYGGVPFGVGRPELVGTHPDYRRRGLIRAQFEVIHGWSAERGHLVQAITGIPWYYRQFGYEMALDLSGGRVGYAPQVPKLKEGEPEPYPVRPATAADLPFIAQLYDESLKRSRVTCVLDLALWRYELRMSPRNVQRQELGVIETRAGEPVGFLAYPALLWGTMQSLTWYELKPGVSWLAVSPAIIRYLWATGQERAARDGKELEAFGFWLSREHPAYHAVADRLPRARPPYGWQIRVPDLPGFVRQIAPALERSLAESPAASHTCELKISFYDSGLRLALDQGRLVAVEPWQPSREQEGNAAFPGRTFLQLVFGYHSLEELRHAFAECWVAGDEAREVLTGLFPKQGSDTWPVA